MLNFFLKQDAPFIIDDDGNNDFSLSLIEKNKFNLILYESNIFLRSLQIKKINYSKNIHSYILNNVTDSLPFQKDSFSFLYEQIDLIDKYIFNVYVIENSSLDKMLSDRVETFTLPEKIIPIEFILRNMAIEKFENGVIFYPFSEKEILLLFVKETTIIYREIILKDKLDYQKIIWKKNISISENNYLFIDWKDNDITLKGVNILRADLSEYFKGKDDKIIKNINDSAVKYILLNKGLTGKSIDLWKKTLLTVSSLLLIAIFILNSSLLVKKHIYSRFINKNQILAAKAQKYNKLVSDTQGNISSLEKFSNNEKMVDIIKKITLRLPFSMILKQFNIERNKNIKLSGTSKDYESILIFIGLLKELGDFEDVVLLSSSENKEKNSEFNYVFSIECSYTGAKKKK